jgi:hypothetical protein
MPSIPKENRPRNRWTLQAIFGWLFLLCFAGYAIGSRFFPITPFLRLIFLIGLMLAAINILLFISRLLNQRRWMIFPALLALILGTVLIFLGTRAPDAATLRDAYMRELRGFENALYVKGGETRNGVDASGLARAALWQAMMRQGFESLNLRLLGPDLWKFWWRDLTTGELLNQKYGYTIIIDHAKNLVEYDSSNLKEGDLAITDPYHTLIYAGNGNWIDANPEAGKVLIGNASTKGNWAKLPVTLLRWKMLVGTAHSLHQSVTNKLGLRTKQNHMGSIRTCECSALDAPLSIVFFT